MTRDEKIIRNKVGVLELAKCSSRRGDIRRIANELAKEGLRVLAHRRPRRARSPRP